eukprot:CAMPEP_0198228798 /NCGR_PEP_ID=MMETSP1445-20131203/113788_1 /TAXON_ID=36898 /ORGANISM="Pyramimonas sp., Strain CCMP2087" /LENGTH=58 /DNA_ID=CAMNT_0043909227 /DNA_START=589 /DNA_END=765 /DNA_ORIENTATION=+
MKDDNAERGRLADLLAPACCRPPLSLSDSVISVKEVAGDSFREDAEEHNCDNESYDEL